MFLNVKNCKLKILYKDIVEVAMGETLLPHSAISGDRSGIG